MTDERVAAHFAVSVGEGSASAAGMRACTFRTRLGPTRPGGARADRRVPRDGVGMPVTLIRHQRSYRRAAWATLIGANSSTCSGGLRV